jgi:hypothetical protein
MIDDLKKAILNGVIAAIIGFSTAFLTYFTNVAETQTQIQRANEQVQNATIQINQLEKGSLGSLEKGQKLCRVLQGKTWRDGLIVPQNWSQNLCIDYMKKTGGNGYQLGCIYSDGTNLGKEDGSFPSPNCGWQ